MISSAGGVDGRVKLLDRVSKPVWQDCKECGFLIAPSSMVALPIIMLEFLSFHTNSSRIVEHRKCAAFGFDMLFIVMCDSGLQSRLRLRFEIVCPSD